MNQIVFPVESAHVLMFARALGDHNPAYLETLGATGTVAPPTFLVASSHADPDYRLRPKPDTKWYGSGATAGTMPEGGGGLHAEQHFTYHRPVRVGDKLTVSTRAGQTWQKQGRNGLLTFIERITDYTDSDGTLVVTARTVGVIREDAKKEHD